MTAHANGFSNPVDRQQEEALQALELSEDGQHQHYVKCQKCGSLQKIVGKLQVCSGRITRLKTRIKSAQQSGSDCKQYYQELAELEADDAKWDRLRHLPLYSSKITGYRFFCSSCWDEAYLIDQEQRKKDRDLPVRPKNGQNNVTTQQQQQQDKAERKTTKQEILESMSLSKKDSKV